MSRRALMAIAPSENSSMGASDSVRGRRTFRWPKEARDLVREYNQQTSQGQERGESDQSVIVSRLAEISGNPRDACIRFLQELGVHRKRTYREWTKSEQQRLLDLITTMPVADVAKVLRRPPNSVRSMLHRLGMGGRSGREWFTKYSLSRALHTRPEEIQKWIDRGWLKARALALAGARTNIIDPDDFCQFVKEHGHAAVSRRLSYDALWFVQNYVFPPSHAELLSVRGTYNKRSDRTQSPEVSETDSEQEESGGPNGNSE